ncbi:MAG: High-affinity branched-chain amino acid transport ATP-binding protein LivF [Gammaproteobacteria bacterium]|nr:High-affinity branched-chain amino acid transport ATP-binding protein LivF [Gammaproteobacteria bacterium]
MTMTTSDSGSVDTVLSVDAIANEAAALIENRPGVEALDKLVAGETAVRIDNLRAGYGRLEILHDFNLRAGKGQALCLIGPNGAGKSTVLHALYGFTRIYRGTIHASDTDITGLSANRKLKRVGIAYVLQDNSVFPDMSVEENLFMGGYLLNSRDQAKAAADHVLERYPRLKERRRHKAGVLSGGERRILEISRALIMDPGILLIDEPSIGLEPRYIDMVFELLDDLKKIEGKTIVMVEQNARKGLRFADIGYVLVSGQLVMAGSGDQVLNDPSVGRLFLGG